MANAMVTWLQNEHFVGVDSSNHSVVLSSREAEPMIGMKPSELLLVSLASCSAVDVVRILKKKRETLLGLEVIAKGVQDPEPPWKYQSIRLHYRLKGKELKRNSVEQAIELSVNKYCSVAASLSPQVDITTDFELDETGM